MQGCTSASEDNLEVYWSEIYFSDDLMLAKQVVQMREGKRFATAMWTQTLPLTTLKIKNITMGYSKKF